MSEGKRNVRVGRLHEISAVVDEMRRVYREARRGDLDTRDASRLVCGLVEIRRGLEKSAPTPIFVGKQFLGRDVRANEISGPIPISAAKRIFLDRIAGIRERLGETDCEVD